MSCKIRELPPQNSGPQAPNSADLTAPATSSISANEKKSSKKRREEIHKEFPPALLSSCVSGPSRGYFSSTKMTSS